MVVNNSTSINKTNNNLSHKIIEHKERQRHMALEIQRKNIELKTSTT